MPYLMVMMVLLTIMVALLKIELKIGINQLTNRDVV